MDIPGRLRATAGIHPHLNVDAQNLLTEAADEIERLRAALQTIVGMCLAPDQKGHGIGKMHAIACRALKGEHAIASNRLRAEIARMRAALTTIFEKSDDIEVCALAMGALTKMKPAAHEQRESPEGIAQSKVRDGEWPP